MEISITEKQTRIYKVRRTKQAAQMKYESLMRQPENPFGEVNSSNVRHNHEVWLFSKLLG